MARRGRSNIKAQSQLNTKKLCSSQNKYFSNSRKNKDFNKFICPRQHRKENTSHDL